VPKCPDTSAPLHGCRSVLGPKCPGAEVSVHQRSGMLFNVYIPGGFVNTKQVKASLCVVTRE